LIYGGGIRTIEEGVQVIQSGADRLTLDAVLHDNLNVVRGLSEHLGAQAVIAAMPMSLGSKGLEWFDYRTKTSAAIGEALTDVIETGVVSEVLLTDWQHEGKALGFDGTLSDQFPCKRAPLIAFGGISNAEQMSGLVARPNVAAIAVGNFLGYREHAIQQFKEQMASAALRPPTYAAEYSEQANV
jgi:cyclase